MKFYKSSRFWLWAVVTVVSLAILQQIWHWEVERIEVASGKFLVRIHRWGKDLEEGQIIAPDESYKGVMLPVWGEGRHWLNPIFWSYEVHDMVHVPPGKCLVLTRRFGDEIPPERLARGDILARENPENPLQGERGVLADTLKEGRYRLNPYAYTWELVDVVEVRVDQVGVKTLKVGLDPATLPRDAIRSPYVVPQGYRGVQEAALPAGPYRVNPYAESVTPVEVRSHRAELFDIKFPSRDGFILEPRVVVEYAVQPEKAPEVLVRLSDEGKLHQEDATPKEQEQNEILQKVILPHIRGYARLEGSNFDARDFILMSPAVEAAVGQRSANAREALQSALLAKVKPRCEELGIEIRAVTLAELRPPAELSEQISLRELARVEQERNQAVTTQLIGQQELVAKEGLKRQAGEVVAAETRLIQAKTQAGQLKEVEGSRLKQELANAQLLLDAASKMAEAKLVRGKAEASVITLQNEAEVAALQTAVQAFPSIQVYAQYHVISRLAPALSEIFASDESEFAQIVSQYLTPAPVQSEGPLPVTAATPVGSAAAGTDSATPPANKP